MPSDDPRTLRGGLRPRLRPGRVLRGHTSWISSVAWSPDGKLVAAADHDEKVLVWEAGTGKVVRRLPGRCVVFAPDGKTLATGGGDRAAMVKDVFPGVVWLW